MTRLWRYRQVRDLAVLAIGIAIAQLTALAMHGFLSGAIWPGLALAAVCVAFAAAFLVGSRSAKPCNKNVRAEPRPPLSGKTILIWAGGFLAFYALGVVTVVALVNLGRYLGLAPPGLWLGMAPLAMLPPYIFAILARPRTRRQWATLCLCIPAMLVAGAASLPAAAVLLSATLPGEPGMAALIAAAVPAYVLLNAPFAVLLVKSGACPLEIDAAEREPAS